MPASPRVSGSARSAASTASGSSGTRSARTSATRPPASSTDRRIVLASALVDRPDEHDADGLSVEHPRDELRVGRLCEVVELDAAPIGARRPAPTALSRSLAQRVDLRLEVLPFRVGDEPLPRQPDPDEDPEEERDEHGRERRDVVAEVEHRGAKVARRGRARA